MKRCRDGYYVQTDHYSCAPIAIINALKYKNVLNEDVHSLEEVKKKCKAVKDGGTTAENFYKAMKETIRATRSVSLRIIKKSLDDGKSMILSYPHNSETDKGHFVFIDAKNRKIINGAIDCMTDCMTDIDDLYDHIEGMWNTDRSRRVTAYIVD